MANEIDQLIREKRLYFIGEKLPSDFYEAFRIWLSLAEAGDVKAQYNVGRCYHNGDGVDKDNRKAFAWYQKAAAQGEPRSHHNLSLMYEAGEACEKCDLKAQEMMTKAAELGEARALCSQADAAFAKRDVEKARSLYQKAADQGHARSEIGVIASDLQLDATYQGFKVTGYSSAIIRGTTNTSAISTRNVRFTISNKNVMPVRVTIITERFLDGEKRELRTKTGEIDKGESVEIPCFLYQSKQGDPGEEKFIGMEVNGEDFYIKPIIIVEWKYFKRDKIFNKLIGIATTVVTILLCLIFGYPSFPGIFPLILAAAMISFIPVFLIDTLMTKANERTYFANNLASVK